MNNESSPTVTINNKEYKQEDLSQKQVYLVNQLQSVANKAANLRFELSQLIAAEKTFKDDLLASVEESKESEQESNADETRHAT
jgi:hypothetical protein